MAEWIDSRMAAAGIKVQGAGNCILHLAGARTRDIVQGFKGWVVRHTLSDIGLL
jgi:hypothetical protein